MDLRNISFKDYPSYYENKTKESLWTPFINEIAQQHGMVLEVHNAKAGYNSTYPTFLVGSYVFKFFGFRKNCRTVFTEELKTHKVLASSPEIKAPKILISGKLSEDWSYLVFNKAEGQSLHHSPLSYEDKLRLAVDLGSELKRVHGLKCDWYFDKKFWQELNLVEAAKKSILPPHLIEQIPTFVQDLDPFDLVFTNSDIVENHIFHVDGKLSSIIDWGDATYTDRHYELAKLYLNSFDADRSLLEAFLKSYNWPFTYNFAKKALGMCFYRQAMGLLQHNTFDVFFKLPGLINLQKIEKLEDLATKLFSF